MSAMIETAAEVVLQLLGNYGALFELILGIVATAVFVILVDWLIKRPSRRDNDNGGGDWS